jgi:hypothetical protein
MAADQKKPGLIRAMFTMKCPSCRQSTVFVHKSIFPLGEMVLLKDECEVCGERLKSEKNNGGGINYALTMMLFFLNLLWYWPVFGLTWRNDPKLALGGQYSVVYYLVISTTATRAA